MFSSVDQIVDKMQLRAEALERELENERDNAQRLKEDNQVCFEI